MSDTTVIRSARLPLLALLALVVVAIAVPLAYELVAPAIDPRRMPLAWGAGQAWALILLGAAAGLFVALLLRPRRPRLGVALGVAIALALAAFAAVRVAPALAIDVPRCGPAALPPAGEWQIEASTIVDGAPRDRLTAQLAATGPGQRLELAGLLEELRPVGIEDLGIERLEPAGRGSLHARHCRALVSGSQVVAAVPPLASSAGRGGKPLVPSELPIWRGHFDWWISSTGELVGARFAIGGHPADAWPSDGLRGQLFVALWPAWMMEP